MRAKFLKILREGLMPPLVERKLFARRLRALEAEPLAEFYYLF